MSLKTQAIIAGLLMGALLGQCGVFYIKLNRANAEILDLKARNAAVESMKELYRGYAFTTKQREVYGYWYEYIDMKERVDSLTQVIKTLK